MPFAATEHLIADAEIAIGRRLPPLLRERLLRANGGEIECTNPSWDEIWQLFPVWDPTDRRTIARTEPADLIWE